MKSVGVDIGGTKISTGLVENGKIIRQSTATTPVTQLESAVVMSIILTIRDVWTDHIEGIGVGVPGLVDVKAGVVYDVQNIPSFKNVALKRQLEEAFHVPVHVSNDANCFAAGIKRFGEGKPFDNLVGLTLGTGLGGGVIIDGKLYEGVGSGAGEFGYIPFREGILEHYCSGQFFKRKYNTNGVELYQKATSGDATALEIFKEYGANLGEAIKIVANVLAPEAVVLGGSIARSFPFFEKSMWESIHHFPYKNVVDQLTVIPVNNPHAAVLGAASLIFN